MKNKYLVGIMLFFIVILIFNSNYQGSAIRSIEGVKEETFNNIDPISGPSQQQAIITIPPSNIDVVPIQCSTPHNLNPTGPSATRGPEFGGFDGRYTVLAPGVLVPHLYDAGPNNLYGDYDDSTLTAMFPAYNFYSYAKVDNDLVVYVGMLSPFFSSNYIASCLAQSCVSNPPNLILTSAAGSIYQALDVSQNRIAYAEASQNFPTQANIGIVNLNTGVNNIVYTITTSSGGPLNVNDIELENNYIAVEYQDGIFTPRHVLIYDLNSNQVIFNSPNLEATRDPRLTYAGANTYYFTVRTIPPFTGLSITLYQIVNGVVSTGNSIAPPNPGTFPSALYLHSYNGGISYDATNNALKLFYSINHTLFVHRIDLATNAQTILSVPTPQPSVLVSQYNMFIPVDIDGNTNNILFKAGYGIPQFGLPPTVPQFLHLFVSNCEL